MDKFQRKTVFIVIGAAYILIAIICDIVESVRGVPYILVDGNYIYYVFSGLCTVATLGSVFISIVVSAFPNKCFGFTMKEIINFSSSGIRVGNIIATSLITIVLAIPFLAANYATTITALAICTVIYILLKSKELWGLLSDDNSLKMVVYSYVQHRAKQADEGIIIRWFNIWFYELKSMIDNKDEKGQDEYLELIRLTIKECQVAEKNTAYARLEKWIKEMFEFANEKLGFIEAYQKIILLGDANNDRKYFDVRTIIGNTVKNIEFCEEKSFSQANMMANIDDIIWELDVDKDTKIYILYQVFSALFNNIVLHSEFKFAQLDLYFQKACHFISNQKINEVLSQTILYAFKNGVLQNENKDSRQKLYLILLRQLFINNRYSNDNAFIMTVAKIFRALYFYIFFETETIKESYREELKDIIELRMDSMDNLLISLPRMVCENSELIIEALIEDVIMDDNMDIFDYFPHGFGAKTSLWTLEHKIRFAFLIYSIFGYRYSLFPVKKYIDDANVILRTKKLVFTAVLNMFVDYDGSLNDTSKENIGKLHACLESKDLLPNAYLKENFEFFNTQLKELNNIEHQWSTTEKNLEAINQELKKLMLEKPLVEFSNDIKIKGGKDYQIMPQYVQYSGQETEKVARRIQYAVRDIVNLVIENSLPVVQLEFNVNGVSTLLSELKKRKIKYRNYTFIDDWGLDKSTRETAEYQELCKKINSIAYSRTNEIRHNIFLSNEGVKVNAEVISYKQEILTEEQADNYIESFKIADGKYKIENVVYNKSEAIQFVKNAIRIESAVVKVKTNIYKESGFKVKFKYS